jgi:hypothetical protein
VNVHCLFFAAQVNAVFVLNVHTGGGGRTKVDGCGQGRGGEGWKKSVCGRHKWMTPYGNLSDPSNALSSCKWLSSSVANHVV